MGTLIEVVDVNRTKSNESKKRIAHCARNGGNLDCFARILGTKIKTYRNIAKLDREEALKRGGNY